MMRVMKCSQAECDKPATWKHGTWYACEDHIKPLLGYNLGMFLAVLDGQDLKTAEEMYAEGRGYTAFGTAYRTSGYFEILSPTPESMTVEVEDE